VVQFDDNKIAIVADDTFSALKGRDALTVAWEPGRSADLTTESIRQDLANRIALSGAENILEAIYEIPFLAHAPMEPMTCVADVRADRAEIWAPTQDRQGALSTARRATGLPQDAITLHVPVIGGAFGRRLQADYVEEAARISVEVGAPVKVFWTRQDDIRHDYYHPASFTRESVQLEPLGRISDQRSQSSAIPTGAWRSVENFTTAFAQQSFVDEVAAATGRDPLAYRLEIEGRARSAVLELCAEKAGWGDPVPDMPDRFGRGMSVFSTFGVTHVAMIADVSVDESDQVRVHRIVSAVDCGTVVNPDTVKAQIEGGIAFGLSAALYGEITVKGGAVEQHNFHDYPILRFDAMPQVEVYILPSSSSPSGIGEMGVPPVAPAIANAIFAATGKRLRKLPFTPEALRSAP
jgi:isoquinoline 1-oxidoreductase beta subunit